MTTYTPAQEFLSEVYEINSFIDDIISCPRKSGWHWPSFYLLYVDVDRLATTLTKTERFFGPPLTGFSAPAALRNGSRRATLSSANWASDRRQFFGGSIACRGISSTAPTT
jgi:hypothetical protein